MVDSKIRDEKPIEWRTQIKKKPSFLMACPVWLTFSTKDAAITR
jgi:hypothetical protein